jgi:hypothetical protein
MKKLVAALVAVIGLASNASQAGVYTDDMAKCLVESSSKEDRMSLVRWMFAAMAQHPAVATMNTVKAADVEKANASTGALFMRLLTEACVDATKKAIKYEGPAAIQLAFQVLGQVASSEIFSAPEVAAVMAGLDKYADLKKLEALKE